MFSIELQRALERYENTFDDCFPTIPLAISREEKEVIDIIDECIKKKKDVGELGYIERSEEVLY